MPPGAEVAAGGGLSIRQLVADAGLVVKAVLLLLVVASMLCWGVIVWKGWQLVRVRRQGAEFLKVFWAGRTLGAIFEQAERFPGSVEAEVFRSGYRELRQLSQVSGASTRDALSEAAERTGLATVERALDAAIALELMRLERGLGLLASTASAAPFIGLFGTVWGIMNAFIGLGAAKGTTIQAVAPGIAEALVATAVGLAAAIPAAIFYNLYANRLRAVHTEAIGFKAEFMNLAQRQVLRSTALPSPNTSDFG